MMALKDVKKMCSKFCTGKSSEIVGYTPPTLHKGVRWFVDFTAFDPARPIKYAYQFDVTFCTDTDFIDWIFLDRESTPRTRNNLIIHQRT